MGLRSLISLILAFTFLCVSTAQAQQPIQLEKLRYKPIVKGKINGKEAYFLLDTGSDLTLLHEDKADYYNFRIRKLKHPQHITGVNGHISEINRTGSIKLTLGTLPIKTSYFTCDISGVIRSIYKKTFIRISGIIGSDVMVRYGFVIDYGAKQVFYDQSIPQVTRLPIHKE